MLFNLICSQCGKTFISKRRDAKYHNKNCFTKSKITGRRKTNEILYQDEFYTVLDVSTKLNKDINTVIDTKNLTPEFLNNGRWYAKKTSDNLFYVVRKNKNKKSKFDRLHRFFLNIDKNKVVDHINNDSTLNIESNLRICTQSQNVKNMPISIANRSGYKGVFFDKDRNLWRVSISINNKTKFIGRFKNKKTAAIAYNNASKEYHGKFGKLNKIL
jgi:hypothetical protein